MNAISVGKPSAGVHPSFVIRSFTQERNTINAVNVGDHSNDVQTLLSIKKYILVQRPVKAIHVEKPPVRVKMVIKIEGSFLEIIFMNVLSVENPLPGARL